MKVSVILPSLNVKQYIAECVESVINQTLEDIEIICVDAGSTDGTLEKLREYEERDSRVKVIVSDKKSYGYQMNLGFDYATGEYIGIVETDDYIPENMYENLYKIAIEKDVDFVKADFYRFTGSGDHLSKAHYKLSNFKQYYNRVINIVHNQETFRFTMNTWSGIYKRSFLAENTIRHNETPGASYQDNGFWFQTFIYAKRAYFVDEPYYMNRRDNENSSVYSKGKVYCICDEYDYILNILKSNNELYEDFGMTYAYACFMAYKANLNRIGDEYKKEFLYRFSEDFRRLRDLGLLDMKRFDGLDWEMIFQLIDDPEKYYEDSILKERKFLDEVRLYDQIIIYGVGMVGRRVYEKLVYCDNPANVISFAVTKAEENYDSYKNIPIREISELTKHVNDCCVVIGTTPVYHEDIRKTLAGYGFENIIAVPYEQQKDEKYYRNMTATERERDLSKWYELNTGKELDLRNPKTLNEKIQWMKLYDESELRSSLSDKKNLRDYLLDKVGSNHLHELIGVYNDAKEIDYKNLPDKCFIRCAHNDLRRLIDKTKGDDANNWDIIARRLNTILTQNHAYTSSMELWYKKACPRLLVEAPNKSIDLDNRYKFICIDGEIRFIVVETNCQIWDCQKRDFYDESWNHLQYRLKYPNSRIAHSKPENLDDMIELAKSISRDMIFSVIIMYLANKEVYVDDVRFTIGSGVEYEGAGSIFI